MIIKNREYIGVTEAAIRIGIKYDAVLLLLRKGAISGHKRSPSCKSPWAIDAKSVENYINSIPLVPVASPTDAAWAAGFIDGEGCLRVGVSRTVQNSGHISRSHVPHVQVACTDKEPLDWLAEIFGGTVCSVRRYKPQHAPCFSWVVCSRRCERVLRATLPYLRIKRPQAELLLILMNHLAESRAHPHRVTPEEQEWREDIRQKISRLNKRKHPRSE